MMRMTDTVFRRFLFCAAFAGATTAAAVSAQRPARPSADPGGWEAPFTAAPADLATAGENPYFVLKPGYQLVLEGKESGVAVRLVVTVLNETKKVGGFETRVVEERETRNGALAEVSRNYFAIHKTTRDVFYFGEDVDVYKNGRVISHEGAWLHGTAGARFGLAMPGNPRPGQRYYQEQAPKVAMDRSEIQAIDARVTTPAGTFDRCVKSEETTPLEPKAREYKAYAPGVGLIKDGTLELVSVRKWWNDPGGS